MIKQGKKNKKNLSEEEKRFFNRVDKLTEKLNILINQLEKKEETWLEYILIISSDDYGSNLGEDEKVFELAVHNIVDDIRNNYPFNGVYMYPNITPTTSLSGKKNVFSVDSSFSSNITNCTTKIGEKSASGNLRRGKAFTVTLALDIFPLQLYNV